ncbi:MAG: hypothetical protein RI884_810 [Pseudomonadota bacterium]|jgi:hypothetical protein
MAQAKLLLDDHRLRSSKDLYKLRSELCTLQRELESSSRPDAAALLERLRNRIIHTETLLRSSSFNVCRTLEERALQWDAAAGVLQQQIAALEASPKGGASVAAAIAKLDGYQRLCAGRAARFRQEAQVQKDADPFAIVDDTKRAAKPAKPKRWGRVDPGFKHYVGTLLSSRPGLSRDTPTAGSDPLPDKVDELRWSEQAVALKCLERALKETAGARKEAGLRGDPPPKHQFKTSLVQILSQVERPRIETTLFLPVPAVSEAQASAVRDGKSSPSAEWEIRCRQTAATHLSDQMHARYQRDGLARATCHDDTQHWHATSLYSSEMRDAKGDRSLLTMARHGGISAFGLTPRGIETMTDERLGQIALDLAARCGDRALEAYAARQPTDSIPSHESPAMRARAAGAYVRRLASTEEGAYLLADLRREASRQRAKEVAEAALCSLPDAEVARIWEPQPGGLPPTVRLTSVALLTPDAFRHDTRFAKYTSDERLMWLDQRDAWQALEKDPSLVLDVPRLDEDGRVMRDAQGRIRTAPRPVKLEVAAFDLPVNAGGVGLGSSLDAVSGHELTAPSNQAALKKLLGPLPTVGSLHRWQPAPSSWVGAALSRLAQDDPARGPILELSRQVARLVVEGRHLGRADDPYILVRRLLVLSHLTEIVAPAVNCRSGKDRTTEAETQARRLAFEIATTGKVPPLDPQCVEWHPDDLEPLRQKVLFDLSMGGGAHDVQDETAGVSGVKLSQAALQAQHGTEDDPELQRDYNGKSSLTGT